MLIFNIVIGYFLLFLLSTILLFFAIETKTHTQADQTLRSSIHSFS